MAKRKTRKTTRRTTKRHVRHTKHHAGIKTELGRVITTLQKIKKAA